MEQAELKSARIAALREFVRLDCELRATNEQFEWQTHAWNCKCGTSFLSFAERALHVLEFDDYINHHPAENPPRRVQCPDCKAIFIHSIPASHADNCKPIPFTLVTTEKIGGFRPDAKTHTVTTVIDFNEGE